MGSVSFREFIRWVPDEASEPTSTLVVTSPERRFVDLRILLTSDENNGIEDHGMTNPFLLKMPTNYSQ